MSAAFGLVYVEQAPSEISEYGTSNAYRLAYIDSYVHRGTRGRSDNSTPHVLTYLEY